eukprot:13006644-Alexandrium_andersonii.AAC.1
MPRRQRRPIAPARNSKRKCGSGSLTLRGPYGAPAEQRNHRLPTYRPAYQARNLITRALVSTEPGAPARQLRPRPSMT